MIARARVASIRHGKQNEKVVRSHYARKMQKQLNKNFTAYDTDLVVNPSNPYLTATPDSKVFDPTSASPVGLLKIKCPYTWRNHTMEAECDNVNFPCSMVDGRVPKLRTDNKQGFISYLLRFSDRIDRLKNSYGNFFIQLHWRIDFLTCGKSRFIQSEISCHNESVSSQTRSRCFWRLFNLHSQKFVQFSQVYSSFLENLL